MSGVKATPGGANPFLHMGDNEWSSGLLSCCANGCKSLICGWCCFPCFACKLSTRMNEHMCLPFIGGLGPMRTRLRHVGNIKGTLCNDVCSMYWCQLCGACQMEREMDNMGIE